MEIVTRKPGGVTVVEIIGRVDRNTSSDAQAAINGLLAQGTQKLLIELAKLDYLNSVGLRLLLATATRMSGSGGELRFCSLNETVQEVFDISGVSDLVNVFKSSDEALNGF